jgi:hypothetical protein
MFEDYSKKRSAEQTYPKDYNPTHDMSLWNTYGGHIHDNSDETRIEG